MKENPYSSVDLGAPLASGPLPAERMESPTFSSIAKSTFLAWEGLRIVYIIVLGLLTILLVGIDFMRPRIMLMVIQGAVIANVCFFAGPLLETYVRWLGFHGRWIRWFLFCGGTLLACLLAIAVLASVLLPAQS